MLSVLQKARDLMALHRPTDTNHPPDTDQSPHPDTITHDTHTDKRTYIHECPGCGEVYLNDSEHRCSTCGETTVSLAGGSDD